MYNIYPRYRISENPIGTFLVVYEKDKNHSAIILAKFDNRHKAKEYIKLRREGRIHG
jgi:hypothetical protein